MSSFDSIGPSGESTQVLGPIPEPSKEIIKTLFNYWKSLKGDKEIPFRNDLNPNEIKALLPNIFILEIINGGEDFCLRLMGTKCVELIGKDYTGKRIKSLPDFAQENRIALYELMAKTATPLFVRAKVGQDERFEKTVEAGYLPLLDKGGNYTLILSIFDYI